MHLSDPPFSVEVLMDCIELQLAKSKDYQNPKSTVKQADYYPSGAKTLLEIVHAKVLRMRSIIETFEHDPSVKVKFESLADSAKDAINYLSFFASWCEGKIPGQLTNRDILNRPTDVAPAEATSLLEACMDAVGDSGVSPNIIELFNAVAEPHSALLDEVIDFPARARPEFPPNSLGREPTSRPTLGPPIYHTEGNFAFVERKRGGPGGDY
jgi:hypothetical protein